MRPVSLGNAPPPKAGDSYQQWSLAALKEIERASNDTLINDTSSSGNAMATLTGAAANQLAYFTSAVTTAFTALPAFARTVLSSLSTGTFIPDLRFGGLNAGITYATQEGTYWKFDKLVLVQSSLLLTNKGAASGSLGPAAIYGLPFTTGTTSGTLGCWFDSVLGGHTTHWQLLVIPNQTTAQPGIQVQFLSSGSTATQATDAEFTNTSNVVFAGCYKANS